MDIPDELKTAIDDNERIEYADMRRYVMETNTNSLMLVTDAINKRTNEIKSINREMEKLKTKLDHFQTAEKLDDKKAPELKVKQSFKIGDPAYYISREGIRDVKFKKCPNCKGVTPEQKEGWTHQCNECHGDGKIQTDMEWKITYTIGKCTIVSSYIKFLDATNHYESFIDDRPIDLKLKLNPRNTGRIPRYNSTTLRNVSKMLAYENYTSLHPEMLLFKTKRQAEKQIAVFKKEDKKENA